MNEQTKTPSQPPATPSIRRVSSRELFNDRKELLIEHAGQHYRLHITRQNKLILTK